MLRVKRHNKAYFYLELKSHNLMMPHRHESRRIRVLLPRDYASSDQSYPVVYMHDGQNVFHSSEAFSGHSWKTIHALKKNPDLPPMIVVGIDNGEEDRMHEYSPWKFKQTQLPPGMVLGGHGAEFAAFVMEVVKPFIDTTYRTKKDRAHTAMIGSSLGANITQFMGVAYQDYIGQLGVFSSANWLTRDDFDRYISRNRIEQSQRIFIQVGTHEGDATDRKLMYGNMRQAYIDESLLYYQQLLRAGVSLEDIQFVIAADGIHSENEWSKHLPNCLRFLSEMW